MIQVFSNKMQIFPGRKTGYVLKACLASKKIKQTTPNKNTFIEKRNRFLKETCTGKRALEFSQH